MLITELISNKELILQKAKAAGSRQDAYKAMLKASSNEEFFIIVYSNYDFWLEEMQMPHITEVEAMTQVQLSEFSIWLLETYCLGKQVDHAVHPIIELHKRVVQGQNVSIEEWAAARAAAWAATRTTAWAAWAAAKTAAWFTSRSAACEACLEAYWDIVFDANRTTASKKLYQIICNR